MIMTYIDKINDLLIPKSKEDFSVLDLFAGCGGLALGFEAQGFSTHAIEMDKDCCATYERNLQGRCETAYLTVESKFPKADVVIGGPPCQPFSVGGKQLGNKDARDGMPVFIEAVKQVNPDIWLIENVRGLLYRNNWYLQSILREMENLNYIVNDPVILNASNYEVAQNRERVFIVGHRGNFSYPFPAKERISVKQALGEMLDQVPQGAKFLTPSMDKYVEKYEQASHCINPRDLAFERPSRTITCRNLAGATGDMMRIRLPDGRRRRLTLREAARLQSFPDWFEFMGEESRQFYQVGNAVPPMLSYHMAKSIRCYLDSGFRYSAKEISDRNRRSLFDVVGEDSSINV
jgi:DNA (cytosine-5)-methyltransferase 1